MYQTVLSALKTHIDFPTLLAISSVSIKEILQGEFYRMNSQLCVAVCYHHGEFNSVDRILVKSCKNEHKTQRVLGEDDIERLTFV